MGNSLFQYGSLYQRLTEIIWEMRKYDGGPVMLGRVREPLCKDPLKPFGCYAAFDEAVDFLEGELIVARQMIRGIPYIGIIPPDTPKCVKIFMQMYSLYFSQVYRMGNKFNNQKNESERRLLHRK